MINPGISSLLIFFIFIVSALAVETKTVFRSIIFMSLAGILTAVVFVTWKAPDVAMTEAAIGAGFTTFLLLMAYTKVKKRGN